MNRSKLLLFPGLGLDARLFEPQKQLPMDVEIIEWIEPESENESLHHYATRMAEIVGPRIGWYVGGVSLGAMVALEIAGRVNASGIIAIGGCSSADQIAPPFRGLLKIGAMLPPWAIGPTLLLAPPALKLLEGMNHDQIALMTQMLREHSPAQIRWSCRAILGWEFKSPPPAPLCAIHGENDEVIPLRNVNAQFPIPGGRHLISLTHPQEVNAVIISQMSAFEEVGSPT